MESEMEDYSFFHEENMNILDEFMSQDLMATLGDSFNQFENTEKTMKTSRWNSSSTTTTTTTTTNILSFKNTNADKVHGNLISMMPKEEMNFPGNVQFSPALIYRDMNRNQNDAPILNHGSNKRKYALVTSPPSHHVIAERKRREVLNDRFIALSAIVPGLKKMDKASVLGGAIKYVKELEEHVTKLEEQAKNNKSMEKSRSSFYDENSGQEFPELEARLTGNDVLIQFQCRNQKGILGKILGEIEKLHLSVVNTSVLPFGTSILDITIVAQMENEHNMTLKEIVKTLKPALFEFM